MTGQLILSEARVLRVLEVRIPLCLALNLRQSRTAKQARLRDAVVTRMFLESSLGPRVSPCSHWIVTITHSDSKPMHPSAVQPTCRAVRQGVIEALGIGRREEARVQWQYMHRHPGPCCVFVQVQELAPQSGQPVENTGRK